MDFEVALRFEVAMHVDIIDFNLICIMKKKHFFFYRCMVNLPPLYAVTIKVCFYDLSVA